MLWIKALHLVAMVAWFAGLFYLPRLFVYHTQSHDEVCNARFKTMERKLFYYIMTPAAALTVLLGIALISFAPAYYLSSGWMHAKLGLVGLLLIFHAYLAKQVSIFARDKNEKEETFYRLINELPLIFLLGIVVFAVVKPF